MNNLQCFEMEGLLTEFLGSPSMKAASTPQQIYWASRLLSHTASHNKEVRKAVGAIQKAASDSKASDVAAAELSGLLEKDSGILIPESLAWSLDEAAPILKGLSKQVFTSIFIEKLVSSLEK
jgi:hypothetical protein